MVVGSLPLLLPTLIWVFSLMLTRTDVWPIPVAGFLFLFAGLIVLFLRKWMLFGVLLTGCLWGLANLAWDASNMHVDGSWLAQPVEISAAVESVQAFPSYSRLRVSHVRRSDGTPLAGRLQLYAYGQRNKGRHVETPGMAHATKTMERPLLVLRPGNRIQAKVNLHPPRNHINPGAFDYRAWCFDRHIAAMGSVSGSINIIDESVSSLEKAREEVRRSIRLAVGNDTARERVSAGGVLQAVLLGDRSRIDALTNNTFAATGTAHLLAISGMHVGMVAAWLFALCWWLLTRREAWIVGLPARLLPVRSMSLLAGFMAAASYAMLAGWPLPAIRSGLMLAAGVLAWLLVARSEPLNILLAALMLILLLDPSAVSSVSLWLSFSATAGVLFWARTQREQMQSSDTLQSDPSATRSSIEFQRFHALFWVSLLAMLATLPVIVSVFGRIPVYGLFANLMMVPLYALYVMPLALAGEIAAVMGLNECAVFLLQMSAWGIDQGLSLISWIAALPAGQLWAVKPEWYANILYLLACIGVIRLLWSNASRLIVAALAIVVMMMYGAYALQQRDINGPTWLVWDVGQGAASTLLLPGRQVMVVDAPGKAGSRFNGGTIVASGLREMGLTHVDVLVLSHAQSDHLGGATSLIERLNKVGEIWLPDTPSSRADRRVQAILAQAEKQTLIRWLARGDHMSIGEGDNKIQIQVLWPPRHHAPANPNNTSLVLLAHLVNGDSILWPGDIEAVAEAAVVQAGVHHVTAMLMPHHGSRTSSSEIFVHALQPSLSVAQTGFANRYGFPDAEVVRRYLRDGSLTMDTSTGAVTVSWAEGSESFDAVQMQPNRESRREIALQWWQGHL